ncbi:HflK protein [Comamonas serinivorans]|uniref:Protein HflK n=1 Tax=Comamonas serinivorans TaxID=1082851 RepID=A0A1Y0EN48_9BURK|nr:FtsH protease activity modulator HflK [Comamonas serinivorans]ARU04848.1 HflK protein [Comamonas serinivorans]
MNLSLSSRRLALLPQRIRGMFNLNDPRWGRDDEPSSGESTPPPPPPPAYPPSQPPAQPRPQVQRPGNPGPDLDEMGREFMRKLGGMWGGNGNGGGSSNRSGGPGVQPGSIAVIVAGLALAAWVASGVYVVNEGEQAVITQFGKYHETTDAGLHMRLPFPIQNHTKLKVTQPRVIDIGSDNIVKATGLRNSAMLTEDENIVEIKFSVQYRLSDSRAYLFESARPDDAVRQVAETAVREVVGQMSLDEALATERDQIAPRVRELMQTMLDRYNLGVNVSEVNLLEGGVRPPEQLKVAFDDVLKAEQERERVKNQALAYAANVVPRAEGTAARLNEEAQGYKTRVVEQAKGDTERFAAILPEYRKSPQAVRDRMYTDAMQQMYSNVSKIVVDSKAGGNLLYLPLDKLISHSGEAGAAAPAAAPAAPAREAAAAPSAPAPAVVDPRSRNNERSRSRELDAR